MAFLNRMIRAARLEVSLYEEVETDKAATAQAAWVVALAAVATGVGGAAQGGFLGLVVGIGLGIVGWAVWAWLNYFLGTHLFKEAQTEANWGQLARTMGFAYTPRILLFLAVIPVPVLGVLVFLATGIWSWIAIVIAVRQSLDYTSTLRAVGVTVLGAVLNAMLLGLISVVFLGL
jgi:hypothetical protein